MDRLFRRHDKNTRKKKIKLNGLGIVISSLQTYHISWWQRTERRLSTLPRWHRGVLLFCDSERWLWMTFPTDLGTTGTLNFFSYMWISCRFKSPRVRTTGKSPRIPKTRWEITVTLENRGELITCHAPNDDCFKLTSLDRAKLCEMLLKRLNLSNTCHSIILAEWLGYLVLALIIWRKIAIF